MKEKIIMAILVVLIVLAGIQTVQLLGMSDAFGGAAVSTTGSVATTTAGQETYSAPAPQMVGGC